MNIVYGNLQSDEPALGLSPLGERLRGLRQQHGLTLRELAEQVGVTATALHSWECGRRNPKHKHLRAFASAFKLSPQELLPNSDIPMFDQRLERVTIPRPAALADVIADCKERIADAAGTLPARVRIIIEV